MTRLQLYRGKSSLAEIVLAHERTTLGRRPYNDIVLEHWSVSGEHVVFLLKGESVWVEDLHSSNGTFLNGRALAQAEPLGAQDLLEIGPYRFLLVTDSDMKQLSTAQAAKSVAVSTPDSHLP
jgi:pSer/pThr/pTyr-binding forkhead associated (FHA) protein